MNNIFTLFTTLLLISHLAIAQNKSIQKSGIRPKSKSSYALPQKKATLKSGNSKKLGIVDANSSKENSATENSSNKNNITGVWRGYFVQNTLGLYEDRYRYEVQLAQLGDNALNSVTYSYKTTVFYGKAEAKGIYTLKTNNIIINELKLVDLKITEQSEPCLMTCYLEFNKMGELETLTGTYSSRNVKDKSDCGSGKVYLEKALKSDFYKEDFVVKRENELKKKEKVMPKKTTILKRSLVRSTIPNRRVVKPGAEGNLLEKTEQKIPPPAPSTVTVPKKEEPVKTPKPPSAIKVFPKPEILKNRNNEIVKTITTHSKDFKVELYDNGEIDGDRISVYHNNELIVSNKTLAGKPISFSIKADETNSVHDFVMVAENLGSIPPNTALMILTAGEQRYELFITSTEQKNAVVRVIYQPQ